MKAETKTEIKESKQTRLAELRRQADELEKQIADEAAKPTATDRLWQLCEGLTMRVDRDKYPDSTFFFKGDEWLVEYDEKTKQLWCRYSRIWSIFETEYGMGYDEIQALIKKVVEAHFKCNGLTPVFFAPHSRMMVEAHFKCNGLTPSLNTIHLIYQVEAHFKCNGLTPINNQPTNNQLVEAHFKCNGLTPNPKPTKTNKNTDHKTNRKHGNK